MIFRPCHRLLQVDPEVQQDQANQQGPGHRHDQLDLGALSRPKKDNRVLISSFTDSRPSRWYWPFPTHRGSFLSSRTWGTLRTRSTRQTNWSSGTGRTSFTRGTLKDAERSHENKKESFLSFLFKVSSAHPHVRLAGDDNDECH